MIEKINENKKTIILFLVMSIIYIYPLIVSNSYYIDDIGRVKSGKGWSQDGRILSDYVMEFFSLGSPITDIFPFNLIVSAMAIGIPSILFINRDKASSLFISALSAMAVFGSPFYLENLSYRFDSIPMSLSVAFIFMPFILMGNAIAFTALSIFCIFLSLMTYQISATAYFILLSIFLLKSLKENNFRGFLNLLIIGLFSFVIAFLLMKITWVFFGIDVSARGSLPPFNNLAESLSKNIHSSMIFAKKLFIPTYFISILPMLFVFILSLITHIRVILKDDGGKVVRVAFSLMIIPSIIICSLGVSLLLVNPIWASRVFIGYGFLYIFIVAFSINNSVNKKLIAASLLLPVLTSFSYSANYANALRVQDEFNDKIASLTYPYISKSKSMQIIINGNAPDPDSVKIVRDKLPLVSAMIPHYFNDNWSWGAQYFKKYDMLYNNSWLFGDKRDREISEICQYSSINENKFFNIRYRNNISIIDFKKTICN